MAFRLARLHPRLGFTASCKPAPAKHMARANAARSEVRAHVEHSFAHQKGVMGLVIRTIGLAGAVARHIHRPEPRARRRGRPPKARSAELSGAA
jgi:hypothetical protein